MEERVWDWDRGKAKEGEWRAHQSTISDPSTVTRDDTTARVLPWVRALELICGLHSKASKEVRASVDRSCDVLEFGSFCSLLGWSLLLNILIVSKDWLAGKWLFGGPKWCMYSRGYFVDFPAFRFPLVSVVVHHLLWTYCCAPSWPFDWRGETAFLEIAIIWISCK